MNVFSHGGDLKSLAAEACRPERDILDFSVNLRPEGMPEFIASALWKAMENAVPYPSPDMADLRDLAAVHYGIPAGCFAFGNGANELIHALPRALNLKQAVIPEPAFFEYRLACLRHGTDVLSIRTEERNSFLPSLRHLAEQAANGSAVFLANPANPSGGLLDAAALRRAVQGRPEVLTKFYGMAGVRGGFSICTAPLAERLRQSLPAWNVNAFAAAAVRAALEHPSSWADRERVRNRERRDDLFRRLSSLPGAAVLPSEANFLLFRLAGAPHGLAARLLKKYGIALRDCSNYPGLETGGWFRSGVRTPEEHALLAEALRAELAGDGPSIIRKSPRPALMIQGTCSDAGKSVLTAALCRIFLQDGYRVAPFKAQNMALNSGVTALGEEMGRAQIVQSQACRVDPDARMNPILLKPHSNTGSQVIVMGRPVGSMDAREYFTAKRRFWPDVCKAYDSLADEYELLCLEGAGSPGEINLKSADVVNMNMARYARARVLLAGDIDRGGVYASFLGTWMTFAPWEKELLAGFVVNKFRGDPDLLAPAHSYMRNHTGKPVLGVIPMMRDINIPEEDRATLPPGHGEHGKHADCLDVAVVMPAHVSNFTDFAPLAAEPDVRLRQVRTREEWGNPDLVILPGTKSVAADLASLRSAGLEDLIRRHAGKGKWILGVCGGLQMLGTDILDPLHMESPEERTPGLGLLELSTTFAAAKTLLNVRRASTPLAPPAAGYEIHHGVTSHKESSPPVMFREDGSPCGYGKGRIWATYLHGMLDGDQFRRAFINMVRKDSGLKANPALHTAYDLDGALDRLAEVVRKHLDLKTIYRALQLKR
ncbi:cobyric acid synthase [uncultured Akkermansia sp.]|uniref:cobyric acid synthase n=1 Tax=uncultured Akkermansia sp. TaxID=512294 RepID=UPI002617EE27|nr:cobyric acid synthase [uncultured Akkermansia sp.]